jgi:hemerythrin
MQAIPEHFAEANSLRDQILYVLTVMHKGSAHEVAAEVIELKGIASEDEVEDVTVSIEKELEELCAEGVVAELREHRQKKRYTLA